MLRRGAEPVVGMWANRRTSSSRCELTGPLRYQSSRIRLPLSRAIRRRCDAIRKRRENGGVQALPATETAAGGIPGALHEQPAKIVWTCD
jgi:hypothetical protein